MNNLTVGVPVYNCADRLKYFLPSLLSQVYPKKLIDLIFVDSESKDRTRSILDHFKTQHGALYKQVVIDSIPHVELANPTHTLYENCARARNRIVELSPKQNDVLFIDSDVTGPSDAIRNLVRYVRVHNADGSEKCVGWVVQNLHQ